MRFVRQVVRQRLLYGHVRTWNKTRGTKNASIFLRMDAVIFLQVCIMYNLLFPKSKVLNFLTPFILFMSSSRTIFLVLQLTFLLVSIFHFMLPMLSFITLVVGTMYILIFWVLRIYVIKRLLTKEEL